mgnify:FL=1
MANYQSALLTERVPYDWDELKRVSQSLKEGAGDDGLVLLTPAASRPAFAPSQAQAQVQPHPERQPEADSAPLPPQVASVSEVEAAELELIARIVPKVLERLNSQMEIIVDVTLDTAASRIRADLKKAIETTVRLTVREELGKLGK